LASQVIVDRIRTPQAAHSPKKAKELAPLLNAEREFWKACLTTGCAASLDGIAARGVDSMKAAPDGRTLHLISSTLATAARTPKTPKRAILHSAWTAFCLTGSMCKIYLLFTFK